MASEELGDDEEKRALENFEAFHQLPQGSATLAQVRDSSVGVEGWASWREVQARAELLAVTARMRGNLALGTRNLIKGCFLGDPDMWPSVRDTLDVALDRMWADVEHEIERSLHRNLLKRRTDSFVEGPRGGSASELWWRLRAFVLHHYLPHDKLMFGRLKDPVYLALTALTCIPVHGLRVGVFSALLLMISFPGPPDEFQLINYILAFKGKQFLTSGVLAMGIGSFKYFACYSLYKDELLQCMEVSGPGAGDAVGAGLDYLMSIALVWIAFLLLPRSKQTSSGVAKEFESSQREVLASGEGGPGGRLRKMLHYDMRCFAATFLALVALTAWLCADHFRAGGTLRGLRTNPQFCANVFWCCVIYALLSLPFVAFSIPGWQAVLVHSVPTGFNRHGACVAQAVRREAQPEGAPVKRSSSGHIPVWMRLATRVVSLIEQGRASRPERQTSDSWVGDLRRGLWASLRARWPGDADGHAEKEVGAASPEKGFGAALWRRLGFGAPPAARRGRVCPEVADLDPMPRRQLTIPLPVASVRIARTEHLRGVDYYCIEAVAEGSLDADGLGEPWQVLRRYAHFHGLAAALGPRSLRYPEAPFPGKDIWRSNPARLEARRVALDAWLRRVVEDRESQGSWAGRLRAFLFDSDEGAMDGGAAAASNLPSGATCYASGGGWAAEIPEEPTAMLSLASTPPEASRASSPNVAGWLPPALSFCMSGEPTLLDNCGVAAPALPASMAAGEGGYASAVAREWDELPPPDPGAMLPASALALCGVAAGGRGPSTPIHGDVGHAKGCEATGEPGDEPTPGEPTLGDVWRGLRGLLWGPRGRSAAAEPGRPPPIAEGLRDPLLGA